MVGPAYDCFSNPLGAIRFLFEKAKDPSSPSSPPTTGGDWGVRDLFTQALLQQHGSLAKVPEINSVPLDAIPANSLVRFRGMVQDMFNVEYYVGAYKDGDTWRTNKYIDAATMPPCEESNIQIWDRRPLYCIPVPGENSWVKDLFSTPDVYYKDQHVGDVRTSQKRGRDDPSTDPEGMEMDNSGMNLVEDKRVCQATINDKEGRTHEAQASLDLNMPLGEKTLSPCLVKVYDGIDGDLKLNDIAEFIGVMTYDPELSIHQGNVGECSDMQSAFSDEDISTYLPASKVPRLHCILYRKLSGGMLFRAIPEVLPQAHTSDLSVLDLRKSLVSTFTEVLGGDGLAAEYTLLHLLSHVHARVEPMAVGKLSLNLMDSMSTSDEISSSLAKRISQTIAALLPRSHLMSLSLNYLNKKLFAPHKDYNSNRLITGDIQLADGTHLMINEVDMKAGQLAEIGLQNVHSIKNLMEWQKVEYDFEFYKMEMLADVPILVFSMAKSRLFPADVVVPLRSTRESSLVQPDEQLLLRWRMYLGQARLANHMIDPSMQKMLEDDLVAVRQEDRTLDTDVFHRWLTLARLISISYGESTLTWERWQAVKDLERRLSERLRHTD